MITNLLILSILNNHQLLFSVLVDLIGVEHSNIVIELGDYGHAQCGYEFSVIALVVYAELHYFNHFLHQGVDLVDIYDWAVHSN